MARRSRFLGSEQTEAHLPPDVWHNVLREYCIPTGRPLTDFSLTDEVYAYNPDGALELGDWPAAKELMAAAAVTYPGNRWIGSLPAGLELNGLLKGQGFDPCPNEKERAVCFEFIRNVDNYGLHTEMAGFGDGTGMLQAAFAKMPVVVRDSEGSIDVDATFHASPSRSDVAVSKMCEATNLSKVMLIEGYAILAEDGVSEVQGAPFPFPSHFSCLPPYHYLPVQNRFCLQRCSLSPKLTQNRFYISVCMRRLYEASV